jgi:hypothetical protein
MYVYIRFILFPLLYSNYSFIYLYKGYASYIHISRGYMKHKIFRTTALRLQVRWISIVHNVLEIFDQFAVFLQKQNQQDEITQQD